MPDSQRDVTSVETPLSFPLHLDRSGYTPTDSFFRRQMNQAVMIDPVYWSVRLGGLVRENLSFSLNDLQSLPRVEIPCTIACENTAPRNTLIGHALWEGVPMRALLEQAGMMAEGQYARITSADGYTTTLTVEALETAVLVYRMNGADLRREHGYPARLVVPGHYGYHMPKWIQRIEIVAARIQDDIKSGAVKPIAAIFAPHQLQTVSGKLSIEGIAYAGEQPITSIEISIDDAPWMPVNFKATPDYSWTPWQIDWTPPSPGAYAIRARVMVGISSAEHSVVIRVV